MRESGTDGAPQLAVGKSTAVSRGRWRAVLEVRQSISGPLQALIIAIMLAVGLAISALILILNGVQASSLFNELVVQTFFNRNSLAAVLINTTPNILVGLAAAVGFRVRFWNIGIEGQIIFGAAAASLIAFYGPGPSALRLPLMAIAALVGGAFWVLPPLLLKLRLRVNEIITTLLLNYVATNFLMYLVYGPWNDPVDRFPHSIKYEPAARLPGIGFGRVDLGLLVAVAMVVIIWWLMQRSRLGFYMRFVEAKPRMATVVGVPVVATQVAAILLSGTLAGLAGFAITAGQEYRMTQSFALDFGFTGVVIAFLARNNPIVVAVVAFLMGGLSVAGQAMKVFYQVPAAVVGLIQASIFMSVAASEFFIHHRVRFVRADSRCS
jgi:ABC-type uncharacterized transport system permease subunit